MRTLDWIRRSLLLQAGLERLTTAQASVAAEHHASGPLVPATGVRAPEWLHLRRVELYRQGFFRYETLGQVPRTTLLAAAVERAQSAEPEFWLDALNLAELHCEQHGLSVEAIELAKKIVERLAQIDETAIVRIYDHDKHVL